MRHPYRRSRLPRLLASTSRPQCSHSRMKSSSNLPLRLWLKLGHSPMSAPCPVYPRADMAGSFVSILVQRGDNVVKPPVCINNSSNKEIEKEQEDELSKSSKKISWHFVSCREDQAALARYDRSIQNPEAHRARTIRTFQQM